MSKRPGDDDIIIHQDKLARIAAEAEYQQQSRRKQVGSSRTGQACDRCKVRKIRCDARTGGCSPCAQNNSECKTTDRITGRATARGHTEHLENENTSLRMYMIELQAQLREKGIEPCPAPVPQQTYLPVDTTPAYQPHVYNASWEDVQGSHSRRERRESQPSLLPAFRSGDIGENYLGVASESAWLSPIEGTSLALFGTKINIAEFMPPEPNVEATATSYETFVTYAFGSASAPAPPLPDHDSCKLYAEWYFRSIQPFIPILHKPDFMGLLIDVYHKGHQMNPAETVMLHMVLAVMNFQWSKRNGSEQSHSHAFDHYHYSLTFIPTLITSHRLEDLQALALICSQLRNQSRPGAAYMFVNMVIGLAIESGLHRSAKAWPIGSQEPHTIEMRKRVFWSLLIFHVSIGGKLGRPMPLRVEDFDIEIPDAVFDNLSSESDMTPWKKCSFRAGIEGFKVLRISMKVYSYIYSVRTSDGAYEGNVRQLEKELSVFRSQIPVEFAGGSQTREEDRVAAYYLQIAEAECQLLLHHPSLCRSSSSVMAAGNLEICLSASSKILIAATHLKTLKSLDTTWFHSTIYVAAIFTTLFAHTERRDQLVSDDMQRLRQDMDQWLDVMGEVGNMLGTGPRLQGAIRNIIDHSVNNINRHLAAKTASAVVASTLSSDDPQDVTHRQASTTYGNGQYSHASQHSQYSQPGYDVGKGQAVGITYTSPPVTFNTVPYGTNVNNDHSHIEAQIQALQHHPQQQHEPAPQQPSSFVAAYHSSPHPPNGYLPLALNPLQQQQAQYETPFAGGPAAWRHFTDNMMPSMNGVLSGDGQSAEYTNTFMALKTDESTGGGNGSATTSAYDLGAGVPLGMQMPQGQQSWPLLQYGNVPSEAGGGEAGGT